MNLGSKLLINDVGFEEQFNNAGEIIASKRYIKDVNQIHIKYIDDLTLAEAIDLTEKLVSVPERKRPLPDLLHARTGHVLPIERSSVYHQLVKTMNYATENEMRISYKKTKAILVYPCYSVDFSPEILLDPNDLEVVDEVQLL